MNSSINELSLWVYYLRNRIQLGFGIPMIVCAVFIMVVLAMIPLLEKTIIRHIWIVIFGAAMVTRLGAVTVIPFVQDDMAKAIFILAFLEVITQAIFMGLAVGNAVICTNRELQ